MVNPSRFASDPRIDKPWGSTLREKLHDPMCLRYINWGAKERQHHPRGLSNGLKLSHQVKAECRKTLAALFTFLLGHIKRVENMLSMAISISMYSQHQCHHKLVDMKNLSLLEDSKRQHKIIIPIN